jgi:hypothetical protein
LLVVGSFAAVFLGLLLFTKFFPIIPLGDTKEGHVMATEVQVGKVKVPAAFREE